MEQYLRAYVRFLQAYWAKLLPSAEFAPNNHFSESTYCTLSFAEFGRQPSLGLEPRSHRQDPTEGKNFQERRHAGAFAE